MHTQTKYKSEMKTAVLGDRTITIKNLTPILPPQERENRRREVEQQLFDVFRKYAGQRGVVKGILVGWGRQRYNIIVGWLPYKQKGANYG